jgi:hypothetical protein
MLRSAGRTVRVANLAVLWIYGPGAQRDSREERANGQRLSGKRKPKATSERLLGSSGLRTG